jgi:4-amino-4-deoxy-L-arabinose transferase-like glycosyltransferase
VMQSMNGYFAAEKSESLLFILVGLIAIGVALWLWMDGHRLKSMAFPLVAIAIIQLLVGSTVFFRTDTQAATLQQQYAAAPAKFKTEETARMQTVMNNFSTYKIIEIALLAIGIGLIVAMRRHDVALGIGAGLVIQSAFMLFLDMFAETRGEDYLDALTKLAT